MISQIKKATKELEDMLSNNDYKLFKEKESYYNQLFENANISFFNTCKICYEINNNKSFCSCEVNFNYGLGVEKTKRIELKNYMDIFQNIDKNLCKTEIYKMDGLTDEEKYILSIEPIFDTIQNEKEEEFVPLIIDLEPNEKEIDFVLSNEDLKVLEYAFKSDIKNETSLEEKNDLVNNNVVEVQFYKDVFLPVATYIAIMQLPILIFIERFFKLPINKNEETLVALFFIFCAGIIGLIILKTDIENNNIRIKFFKNLFSEKSQIVHFTASLVIVAISIYEITILFSIIIGIIWIINNLSLIKSKCQENYYKLLEYLFGKK